MREARLFLTNLEVLYRDIYRGDRKKGYFRSRLLQFWSAAGREARPRFGSLRGKIEVRRYEIDVRLSSPIRIQSAARPRNVFAATECAVSTPASWSAAGSEAPRRFGILRTWHARCRRSHIRPETIQSADAGALCRATLRRETASGVGSAKSDAADGRTPKGPACHLSCEFLRAIGQLR